MEQNQIPPTSPNISTPVAQTRPSKTNLLLFILLMVTALFSLAVILNYQVQQAELEAEIEDMTTETLIKRPSVVNNAEISTSDDVEDIDVGSIEADMQEIRYELKGL